MKVNGKYRILHSCYWMMIHVAFGYTAFYLGGFGFSAGMIGVLTAVYGVVSAILQPVIGRIADRSSRFGWKMLILTLSALCCAVLIGLYFTRSSVLVAVLFGAVAVLINCIMPLINTVCFYYQKKGEHVDFGIARGIGSFFYAALAAVLGNLTVIIGRSVIPLAGIPIIIALFLVVWSLPYEKEEKVPVMEKEEKKSSGNTGGTAGFLKKYPAFSMMLLGSVVLLSVHNLNGTFLIQMLERVGGNSGNLGTALAISAMLEVPMMLLFTYIVRRIPESTLLVISGVAYVGKSVMLMLAGSVGMIYAAQLMQPFSYALYASASVFFTNRCMKEEDASTGQALMSMTAAIGSVVGNLLGGWLIDLSGILLMLQFTSFLAVAAAGLIAVAVVMYRKEKRGMSYGKNKQQEI